MATPTNDDLLLTEEDFAKKFLGLDGKSIAVKANRMEQASWNSFWTAIRGLIETSTDLNWQTGESAELKALKAKLKDRAFKIFKSFYAIGTDARAKGAAASETIKQADSFVGQFAASEEDIRDNEVIRIAQTVFGPENLDPTNIHVTETFSINRLGTLRADTDAAVKLPRSVTQITVDLVFAGAAEINDRLRFLLATLIASPITTMESPFLTAALINHYSTPEIEEAIRQRVLHSKDNRALLDSFKDFSENAVSNFDKLRELIQNSNLALEYYRQLAMDTDKRVGVAGAAATATETGNLPDIGVPVPVVLQDVVISTDPASPNTLHVRLTFLRYNSSAFGVYGLEYRDGNGNRTPDIMRCEPLRRYVEWAFLTPGTHDRATYLEPYKAHLMQDEPDLKCTWGDILNSKVTRTLQTNDFVVESVQLSFGIKLVPLPLIGSKYPAVHIMGRSNVEAHVSIQTTSKETVRQFALMKDHLDAISRNTGGQFRDEQITIENSVLNLVGSKKFLIVACDMSPLEDTSNAYTIDLSLMQAEYDYTGQQSLILQDQSVPDDAIREVWDRLWELYQSARTKNTDSPVRGKSELTPQEKLAMLTMFGWNEKGNLGLNPGSMLGSVRDLKGGLIKPSIITAACIRMFGANGGLKNTTNYATFENVVRTYQRMFLSDGALDANGDNTSSARGAQKIVEVSGKHLQWVDNGVTSIGEMVRRCLIGKGATGGDVLVEWAYGREVLINPDTRGTIGLTKAIWDQMLEVILDAREAPAGVDLVRAKNSERASEKAYDVDELNKVVVELVWLFTSGEVVKFGVDMQKYVKAAGERPVVLNTGLSESLQRRLRSNYPDLPLPTYEDIFPSTTVRVGPFGAFRMDQMVVDENGVTVPVWTRFAPTYSDLGVYPPLRVDVSAKKALTLIARKKNDTMEPCFWFYHERLRHKMIAVAEAGMKVPGQTFGESTQNQLKVNVNVDRVTNLPPSEAEKMLHQVIKDLLNENRGIRESVKEGKQKNVYYDLISSEGCAIGAYVPADRTAGNNEYKVIVYQGPKKYIGAVNTLSAKIFDRQSEAHSKAMVMRALQSAPDNTFSVARCYPTFRIYFVEWDNNLNRESANKLPVVGRKVRMIDDMYTANCILRFVITDSKDDAAVAEVELLNTLGTFDTDSFLLPEDAGKLGTGNDDDSGGTPEDFLTRMRLQTGTGIVIQMGYSSDVDGLKTVFTGQITEIEPGKVLRFIAQGYKAELEQEVSFSQNNGNPRQAINKLLRIGSEKKNLTPHLGRVFDSRDLTDKQRKEIFGQEADRTGTLGLQGPGGFISRTFGYTLNDVSRNVWMDSDVGPDGVLAQLWRDTKEFLFEHGRRETGEQEYHFYNQTAWQGLQEMTRHLPGTICAVRTFDNEATCFFGYPDQPYQYRTPRGIEMWQWDSTAKYIRLRSILGLEHDVLNEFWGSEYGTSSATLTEKHFQHAKSIGNLPDTGKTVTRGGFPWLNKYRGGSAVGKNLTPGFLSDISPSYTGFIRWAFSVEKYTAGLNDVFDDFKEGLRTGVQRIPIFESLALDFTEDWQTIEQFSDSKQLARFLFAYFFDVRYTGGVWPGSMEAWWLELTRKGMGPLLKNDLSPNETWQQFKLAINGGNREQGAIFPGKLKDIEDVFFGDPSGTLKAAQQALDEMVRSGIITKEEAAERLKVLEDLAKKVVPLPNLGVVNPAYRPRALSPERKDPEISKALLGSWPFFRLFVHYFATWMRQEYAKGDKSTLRSVDVQKNMESLDDTQLEPWFKPFRDYHVVFAEHDIIDNSIVATAAEMVNTILIRGHEYALSAAKESGTTASGDRVFTDGQEWVNWPNSEGVPFHPKIKTSSRKLGVAIEPNVNGMTRAAACLMTNMALGLRPMYRGEIKVVGRVMNPWDVLIINDSYNAMYGVVEVERVTHEFSSETGWITTIVPHAYAQANNPWGLWQLSQVTSAMAWARGILLAIDLISLAMMIFGAGVLIKGAVTAAAKFAAARGVGALAAAKIDTEALHYLAVAGVKEAAEGAVARGAIKTAGIYAEGAGRWLAQNWFTTAKYIGKYVGTFGTLNAVANPLIDFMFNMTTKMQISNTIIPVDFRPISYKGFPLTAGLDLTDEQVLSYGDKIGGLWAQIVKDFKGFFKSAIEDNPGGLTPPDKSRGENTR